MTNTTEHHCPGCGTSLAPVDRYPWDFCNACAAQATDGKVLEFSNVSVTGGCRGAGGESATAALPFRYFAAFVDAVIVSEARFGGVVVEPVHENYLYAIPKHVTVLSRPSPSVGDPVSLSP